MRLYWRGPSKVHIAMVEPWSCYCTCMDCCTHCLFTMQATNADEYLESSLKEQRT